MADEPVLKSCFVICPIGETGSETRAWSDDIFHNLLSPITSKLGYYARRAIDESRPGEITSNIVADIVGADLVIADLTDHNANVFYELAIRHAQGAPFIHVARAGTKIPFDVSPINVVFIDRSTFAAAEQTKSDIERHITSVVEGRASYDNPLKRHQERLQADQTGDPAARRLVVLEDQMATVLRALAELNTTQTKAPSGNRFFRVNTGIVAAAEEQMRAVLLSRRFRLFYNPNTKANKFITFNDDGSIGAGRNKNESHWRIANGRLEILDSNGAVHSRFIFSTHDNRFHHTSDPDLPSVVGQWMTVDGVRDEVGKP